MPATSGATAADAGTLDLGGDLTVNRLGFGAMRVTGRGIWGDPPDRNVAAGPIRNDAHDPRHRVGRPPRGECGRRRPATRPGGDRRVERPRLSPGHRELARGLESLTCFSLWVVSERLAGRNRLASGLGSRLIGLCVGENLYLGMRVSRDMPAICRWSASEPACRG